jgi:hypothetical protein
MATPCRDFDRRWNRLLDRRDPPPAGPDLHADGDADLAAHAAHCPRCRARAAGYDALRLALDERARAAPEPAAPALTARILDAWRAEAAAAEAAAIASRTRPILRAAALAAALALAIGLGLLSRGPRRPDPAPAVTAAARPTAVRPLAESLADATAATLDLARETSAPAARLGRLVLASAAPAGEPDPAAEALALPISMAPSAEVLESVGDGLRPLSGSARRAFGFLLGPATAPTRPAAMPSPGA